MIEDIYTRRYLLWSLQRALLGEVTPELRGVTARIEGREVFSRFLFDVEITPEISERVSDAETEVIADYGGFSPVRFTAEFVPITADLRLLDNEVWAYRRYEAPRNP